MRIRLSKKEIRSLQDNVLQKYGLEIDRKDKIELEGDQIIYINEEPAFFLKDNAPFPTLKSLLKKNYMKRVTVDMGAVKFVANGADIMRPGIRDIEGGIMEGDAVCIVDELHGKPLAVGIALFSGDKMNSMDSGKVIRNLHYVGDSLWNSY